MKRARAALLCVMAGLAAPPAPADVRIAAVVRCEPAARGEEPSGDSKLGEDEAEGRWARADARIRASARRGLLAGRWGSAARGFGRLEPRPGTLVVAGDVDLTWGAGALLPAPDRFSPFPAVPAVTMRAGLFHANGSLALREERTRGAAAMASFGRASLFAWAAHRETCDESAADHPAADRWGAGLFTRSLGVMALSEREGERDARCASLVVRMEARDRAGASDSTVAPPVLVLEAAGRWTGERAAAEWAMTPGAVILGACWRLPLREGLGRLEGALHWRKPETGWTEVSPAGWRFDWELPIMRGILPSLGLRLRRLEGARAAPGMERSTRLALAAEPWSGCAVHLVLGSTETEDCRGLPGSAGGRAILRESAGLLDLSARIAAGGRRALSLRFRDSRARISADEAGVPAGLPGREEDVDGEPGPASRAWDRGEGSLARIALEWSGAERAWGGLALAAVPGDSGLPGFVAVRDPSGASRGRTLARGSWLSEIWAGTRLRGCRCEAVLRIVQARDEPVQVVLLAGAARRWM